MNGIIKFKKELQELLNTQDKEAILDWIDLAEDFTEDSQSEADLYKELNDIRGALKYVKNNFSAEVLQKSLRLCILANEIISGAICFNAEYSSEQIKDLAASGLFMDGYIPPAGNETGALSLIQFVDLNNTILLIENTWSPAIIKSLLEVLSDSGKKDSQKFYDFLISGDASLRIINLSDPSLKSAYLKAFTSTTAIGTLFRYSSKKGIEVIRCPILEQREQTMELSAYRQAVINDVKEEYDEFQTQLLLNTTPEQVFQSAGEIFIKTKLKEVILSARELPDRVYKALYQEAGKILETLYPDFMQEDSISVDGCGNIAEYLEDYCYRNHPEIMEETD